MKRFQINSAKMLLPALLAVTLFSCVRKDNFFPSNSPSTRKAIVSILGGGTPANIKKNPVDFVSTSQRLLAIDLRRDPNDQGDLNTTMTVVVKDDTAAVHTANAAYQIMPTSWYSFESESPRVGGIGGTFTFVFKPGEFAKQIYLVIPNATLLDPSALYGFGFTITSIASGTGMISASKSLIIEVGAKNNWDGVYAVTGPMIDAANPALTQFNDPTWDPFTAAHGGAWELDLVTVGANECIGFDETYTGWPAHPILSSGSTSGYGGVGLIVQFDGATNKVSKVYNWYGDPTRGPANSFGNPAAGSGPPLYQASNTRYLTLDPAGINAVQSNKDILVKYLMYQPSVIAGVRTTFNEKWQYIGPR